MKTNKSWIFFILGLIPFGIFYYPIKAALEPWLFVSLAIIYLIVLRIVSDYLGTKFHVKRAQ